MKIEIEEKEWVKVDEFESLDIEVMLHSEDLSDFKLEELINEKFPRQWSEEEGKELDIDGYFYGVGYVPCYAPAGRRVAFRVKSSDLRKLIWTYTNRIARLKGKFQKTK